MWWLANHNYEVWFKHSRYAYSYEVQGRVLRGMRTACTYSCLCACSSHSKLLADYYHVHSNYLFVHIAREHLEGRPPALHCIPIHHVVWWLITAYRIAGNFREPEIFTIFAIKRQLAKICYRENFFFQKFLADELRTVTPSTCSSWAADPVNRQKKLS